MEVWIGLLRGINVGGTGKLPMAELRQIAGDLGWQDVETHIQSGNLVFRAHGVPADMARDLSGAIERAKGFAPRVLIRSLTWAGYVLANVPFQSDDPSRLLIYALGEEPKAPDLDMLTSRATMSETFLLKDDVFYLHAPDGIGCSKLAEKVERALGVPATARNLRSFTKLVEMARAK